MDFFRVKVATRGKKHVVSPQLLFRPTKDLMIRGGDFYAVWDEQAGFWSRDLHVVIKAIDDALYEEADKIKKTYPDDIVEVRAVSVFDSTQVTKLLSYFKQMPDNYKPLDEKLVFLNTPANKKDYSSKTLPYALAAGDISGWGELVGTLYDEDERRKLEWAIGSIVSGDSVNLQKMFVLYGGPGTGKSTILKILEQMFVGYTVPFDAKRVVNGDSFALEMFRTDPLLAISHDTDLSKIVDNTILNGLVSHDMLQVNEKYKKQYAHKNNALLFLGTNTPIHVTDTKSGLLRRIIVIQPTEIQIPRDHYEFLIDKIKFEHGAIAWHCLQVYKSLGMKYYDDYVPVTMISRTNPIYNFLVHSEDRLEIGCDISLRNLYDMYKEYCEEGGIRSPMPQYKFRDELRPYFKEFKRRHKGVYSTFVDYLGYNIFDEKKKSKDESRSHTLVMNQTESILDNILSESLAQYANEEGTPNKRWAYVLSTLADLDTSKLHYVKVPENHIVIDFDYDTLERNMEIAAIWPPTYAEISQSGNGVHLHYIYDGDVSVLSPRYDEHIEIKVYKGNAALRRKLTKCNNVPVATITNGLPKKEKRMPSEATLKSEKALRDLIMRNIKKEIHPGTKPSIDFIQKILEDAYESSLEYDLTDMRGVILAFAANSSNNSEYCVKAVQKMKFKSKEDVSEPVSYEGPTDDSPIVFFDVEVFQNLFVVCWKYQGEDKTVVKMINPKPEEIAELFRFRLVGFNNRRYDNHILYARYLWYDNDWLYKLSQKIINNGRDAYFAQAFDLSYTDIYDFSSKKQGLKKFGIELGLTHMETDIPWDMPVPEDRVMDVVDYCANDVLLTEAVWNARQGDWNARLILSSLSGLSPNATTAQHTARIIFEGEKDTKQYLEYTDLSETFPGYVYDGGVSTYRDEVVGEGGYVYAEPGMYENVTVLDVASMHPSSILSLNLFGQKTKNFADLMYARLSIKVHDYDAAGRMLDGKLKPFLKDESMADDLAYALKIVINTVYGLTSARFDNPFRDIRNKDNIVAKRGALFMIDLKHAVQEKGYQVVHIKTDSIKIPNADDDIIWFIKDFGIKYGYTFELEDEYEKFCLVNDAVYVAKVKSGGPWKTVGAQFQHPYVFKTLFSNEPVTDEDLREARSVSKGAMYLNTDLTEKNPTPETMKFIGRTGLFVPVLERGGTLYRHSEGKNYTVTGTKGHLWMEVETYEGLKEMGVTVPYDLSYYDKLVDSAINAIQQFGDIREFTKG